MIDSRLTKKELIAKLIKAEEAFMTIMKEVDQVRRERDAFQNAVISNDRQTEAALTSLSNIRQAIEAAHATCYPLCYLEDAPDIDDPKSFNLLKHIHRLANRF